MSDPIDKEIEGEAKVVHQLVLMDHIASIDQDYTFEKFVENLRKWLGPGQWINVQLSDGSPSPVMNLSLIVKYKGPDSKKKA